MVLLANASFHPGPGGRRRLAPSSIFPLGDVGDQRRFSAFNAFNLNHICGPGWNSEN